MQESKPEVTTFVFIVIRNKNSKISKLYSAYEGIIGIKHGFSCINNRQVPWEVLKTEVNALKNHARSLLLHKN